jgi:signal peptidase I
MKQNIRQLSKPVQGNKRGILLIVFLVIIILVAALLMSLLSVSMNSNMVMSGETMSPTLEPGQGFLLLDGFYESNPINRGDIVAIKLKALDETLIRRVVAIPGDSLEFTGGRIILNGEELNEPYLKDPSYLLTDSDLRVIRIPLETYGSVPNKSYLVLNDNRGIRGDSRTYGFIPLEYIVGKVII